MADFGQAPKKETVYQGPTDETIFYHGSCRKAGASPADCSTRRGISRCSRRRKLVLLDRRSIDHQHPDINVRQWHALHLWIRHHSIHRRNWRAWRQRRVRRCAGRHRDHCRRFCDFRILRRTRLQMGLLGRDGFIRTRRRTLRFRRNHPERRLPHLALFRMFGGFKAIK